MLQKEKPKLKIEKKIFYILLFLTFIYILSYTIYLLSAMILNTEIYDSIIDKKIRNASIVKWMAGKIISYAINSIMLLCFLLYISLGRNKVKLGYIFIIIWIVIFIGLTATTHALPGSHDEPIRLSMGIVSSISSGLIIITLISMAFDLFFRRKMYRREMYKVFKAKN